MPKIDLTRITSKQKKKKKKELNSYAMADQEYFWSTVLDSKTTFEWNPEKDFPKGEDEALPQHKLIVKFAVLSPSDTNGETTVVEMETKGYGGAAVKIQIAVLTGGICHQTNVNLSLRNEPVKFVLVKGSGPLYLVGAHQVTFPETGDASDPNDGNDNSSESGESGEEEEGEGEEEEEAKPEK